MSHVRVSQSPNSQCVAFTVVFLALMLSCRGQKPVIGPSEPVVALVGEDIILPCHLNPAMNAFEMTLEWARPDLNPRFVFVWRDGVELKSKKHPLYEGRTSLFTDELKNGNISVILSKVRLSDEGVYKCLVPDYGESKVQLVVGVVSTAVIEFVSNKSREVVLQCEAKGWYPEPEVFWLDGEGNLLSAGPTETARGPDDIYTVSRRLTVEKSDDFTCRVQQKNIKQTRETHFYVPDHFFVVPSTSNQHVVIGSIIGCAALMVILAAVFVLWKRKQRKSKNKMTSPEDGEEQTEKGKTITSKSENTESVPLMAAREEKNNEDNRGEEIKSQSEHKDAEFVMERETHQDQLRTKPEPVTCNQNMDVTEGEKIMTSMNNEEATLIPTRGETQRHQNQDNLSGKQVKKDRDKSEGEKTIKPVKEVSGLPVVLVHTDQEVQKEEETQPMEERQPVNGVDKKEVETKKKKKQEQAEQRGSGWKKQPENQRERMKQKAERQKMENKRKRELELERRREGVKDETEVKPQQRDGDRHLLEDKTHEESKTEHEDDKGDDREGNKSDFRRTTERTAENQEEQRNKNVKEKQQMTRMTEKKVVNQKEQMEEKLERSEEKRDDRGEQQLPSVSREVTERPNRKKLQETAERTNKEVQEENKKGNGNQLNSSGDQHLLEDKTESEAEHENKKGNDQEGNQSDFMRMTERTAENQEEQMNENLKETEEEREFESEGKERINSNTENIEVKRQGNQHVSDTSKQEAEQDDKKGNNWERNQSDSTRMTERTAENQEEQMDENLKETEERRDDRREHGWQLLSVSREVTARPNQKIHQETAERKNKEVQEEKELQAEKQQEETKEQPERSTKVVNVEFKERQSDKGADDDETQKTSKETEKQEQLQAAKEEIREQPQNYFKFVAERGVKSQDVQQEELMEVDPTPDTEKYQRKMRKRKEQREREKNQRKIGRRKKQPEETKQLHVSQQQSARRKRRQEGVQKQKKIKKCLEELSDHQMEVQNEGYTEQQQQQVIHEPQRMDLNSQPFCQEDQQEDDMEL